MSADRQSPAISAYGGSKITLRDRVRVVGDVELDDRSTLDTQGMEVRIEGDVRIVPSAQDRPS